MAKKMINEKITSKLNVDADEKDLTPEVKSKGKVAKSDADESDMEPMEKEHEQHEIESAAQDLLRAEKVKDDKELHAKALEHLSKQKKAIESISSIDDLKKKRNEMAKA